MSDEIKALRAGNNPSPSTSKQNQQSNTLIIKPSRLSNISNGSQTVPPKKSNAPITNNNPYAGQSSPPRASTTAGLSNTTPINNNICVNVPPSATNSITSPPSTVQHPLNAIAPLNPLPHGHISSSRSVK